jgi:glycerophosphoryl diester phosphodiesterase
MVLILPSQEARATRRPRAAPIVIAHRGASADRPEHTLHAYREGIAQGADYIEPDLVMTKDGVLVARHENDITGTTDVAQRAEFASRRKTKIIDDEKFDGWFTEDFTLAELKTLDARERLPHLRPHNMRFSVRMEIPTLDEIIDLANTESVRLGRRIGLYPETKHPSYHHSIGLPQEERLLTQLKAGGFSTKADPVFIQSFEVGNLKSLRQRTSIRLIQLINSEGGPADQQRTPDMPASYAEMIAPTGLKQVATYADGIGVAKGLIIPASPPDKTLGVPTSLVAAAHQAGLLVHAWTFRPERYFLPAQHAAPLQEKQPWLELDPQARRADGAGEVMTFLKAGVDGVFADHPADAVAARQRFLLRRGRG